MLTTFPQFDSSLEIPELLSQNLICYHWLSVSGNSKIMHCGILINMPYSLNWLFLYHFLPSGNYEEALSVITNIEQQAPDNMCVINHKLNMIRRHGDDLCDLYKSYMKNQKIGTDSVKLLMSKFARYLAKVWYKQKHANCQSTWHHIFWRFFYCVPVLQC